MAIRYNCGSFPDEPWPFAAKLSGVSIRGSRQKFAAWDVMQNVIMAMQHSYRHTDYLLPPKEHSQDSSSLV